MNSKTLGNMTLDLCINRYFLPAPVLDVACPSNLIRRFRHNIYNNDEYLIAESSGIIFWFRIVVLDQVEFPSCKDILHKIRRIKLEVRTCVVYIDLYHLFYWPRLRFSRAGNAIQTSNRYRDGSRCH